MRSPLLQMIGPLTVKEAEALVFHAARRDVRFEAAQRTWLEEDRSYFVRYRSSEVAPLEVIGLVHAFQLPEMACRVEVIPFDAEDVATQQPLNEYVQMLRTELENQDFM